MCLLLLQTTFSRFVFGHLFFYCHVGYWFFSSGNINYVCFSSVTIALCLFYSPSVTIFLSILVLLLQSQFVQWFSPLLVFPCTNFLVCLNKSFPHSLLAELFSLPFLLTFYSLSRFLAGCSLFSPPPPPHLQHQRFNVPKHFSFRFKD